MLSTPTDKTSQPVEVNMCKAAASASVHAPAKLSRSQAALGEANLQVVAALCRTGSLWCFSEME